MITNHPDSPPPPVVFAIDECQAAFKRPSDTDLTDLATLRDLIQFLTSLPRGGVIVCACGATNQGAPA